MFNEYWRRPLRRSTPGSIETPTHDIGSDSAVGWCEVEHLVCNSKEASQRRPTLLQDSPEHGLPSFQESKSFNEPWQYQCRRLFLEFKLLQALPAVILTQRITTGPSSTFHRPVL